jgi:hypothetical protein
MHNHSTTTETNTENTGSGNDQWTRQHPIFPLCVQYHLSDSDVHTSWKVICIENCSWIHMELHYGVWQVKLVHPEVQQDDFPRISFDLLNRFTFLHRTQCSITLLYLNTTPPLKFFTLRIYQKLPVFFYKPSTHTLYHIAYNINFLPVTQII